MGDSRDQGSAQGPWHSPCLPRPSAFTNIRYYSLILLTETYRVIHPKFCFNRSGAPISPSSSVLDIRMPLAAARPVDRRIRRLKSEVGPSGGGSKVLENHTQVRQVGLSVGAHLTTYRLITSERSRSIEGRPRCTYRVLPSAIPLYDVIARGAFSHSSEQCEVGGYSQTFQQMSPHWPTIVILPSHKYATTVRLPSNGTSSTTVAPR